MEHLIKPSSAKKALKSKPKRGRFKNSKLFMVHFEDGHQVCGLRFVWAVTGRKWAYYFVPIYNIRRKMKLKDWVALNALPLLNVNRKWGF